MPTLWYDKPAQDWNEALPIGNGRLGAMVFGGTGEERFQLNEDTLWSGHPYSPLHDDAASALADVRRLLDEGRLSDAERLTAERLMGRPRCQQAYVPMADLTLSMSIPGTARAYRRELALDRAVTTTSFRCEGTTWTRQSFISAPDQVLAIKLDNDAPGSLCCDIALSTPHADHVVSEDESGLLLIGHYTNTGKGQTPAWTHDMSGPGVRFAVRVHAEVRGGRAIFSNGVLRVTNADAIVLRLVAATSFVNYRDISADPIESTKLVLNKARGRSFEELLHRHEQEHRAAFDRVSIELGTPDPAVAALPIDQRLQALRDGKVDPALDALFCQFGRYLLIASSRPGSQPANLQGIWNHQMIPAWGSKWTTNINLQMNYWPAEPLNLADFNGPLFDLIDDLRITGGETARRHYNCRGWVVHHNTDLWRAAAPVDGPWGMWPTGAAWLCRHLWDHYLYSLDKAFLRERAYPAMKAAAEFVLDFLRVDPVSGCLVITPSTSPENSYRLPSGQEGCMAAGTAMDHAIVRELLEACRLAAQTLDVDEAFQAQLMQTLSRLAPLRIGSEGQVLEWMHEYTEREPGHRHMSHLYALHPGTQITWSATPELAAAAMATIERRLAHGGGHTGWSAAWIVNFYARLLDGEAAYAMLQTILRKATLPNLFNTHPPFQIDGNFGAAAGMAEMLLQSHEQVLHLLPALPKCWASGNVQGLRARGAFDVAMRWRSGSLEVASITAHRAGTCRVRYQHGYLEREVDASQKIEIGPEDFRPVNTPEIDP